MIQDYLEVLARELDFDRSLSRCVRQEVDDHLWETVAAERVYCDEGPRRMVCANAVGDQR